MRNLSQQSQKALNIIVLTNQGHHLLGVEGSGLDESRSAQEEREHIHLEGLIVE